MKVIDRETVAFESELESKYIQFRMERLSKENLWEMGQLSFIFKGDFSEYIDNLSIICLLSIEQGKDIILSNGLPIYNGMDIQTIRITGFSVKIYLEPGDYKQKRLNKLANHWVTRYCFENAEVIC